jgi:hypothetical protein
MKVRRLAAILSVLALAYGVLWVCFANPFNAFVPRSEHFSLSRFQTIGVGSSIAEAVRVLGKPIKVVKADGLDPSCPACVSYCFMGEPPKWGIGFQEAWLVADQQGRIVGAFLHREP